MVKQHPVTSAATPGIPTVMHVGFAGARKPFDSCAYPGLDAGWLSASLVPLLQAELDGLRETLGLMEPYFPCGVSSLASGADTLFTQACQALQWPQRLFLPQQRNDFLAGVSKSGSPDFTDAQAATARELLQSPHIIEERVASDALERVERFQDVNLEIMALADVVVCLLPADAPAGKPGGTAEFLQHAIDNRLPALELRIQISETGIPTLQATWHNKNAFQRPMPPTALAGLKLQRTGIPTMEAFCASLKAHSSQRAQWQHRKEALAGREA
ncbi:MAG: hypothetical protein V4772_25325, partial [Pseudomonadota bacterium]